MDLRTYSDIDYPMVAAWWKQHHGNVFERGFIPPTAYVVTDGISDIGFFSMHDMQCDICYFGYPMVNPNMPKDIRDKAVDYMIECAKLWGVKTGHKYVYISIRGEKMLSRLEQNGFVSGEDNCQHMFCKVGETK